MNTYKVTVETRRKSGFPVTFMVQAFTTQTATEIAMNKYMISPYREDDIYWRDLLTKLERQWNLNDI